MPESTVVVDKTALSVIQSTLNQQNESLAYLTAQAKIAQQARTRALVCKSLLFGIAIGAAVVAYVYFSHKKRHSVPEEETYSAEDLH